MISHRTSIIAAEGWPLIFGLAAAAAVAWRLYSLPVAAPVFLLLVLCVLLFRDPRREIPPLPLGVVAPVDGSVLEVNTVQDAQLPGRWTRIKLRANPWGAYTVRSPIEGAVLNMREQAGVSSVRGLWVRSEENDDVVLLFPQRWAVLPPKAFVRFGERLGQGQRFAYLRLAFEAELFIPATAQLRVAAGDSIKAGCDVIADLVQE